MELIWPWIAFGVTLVVLSRIFGDNPLFRISQYFYVGLALGYTVTILLTELLVEPIRAFNTQGATAEQAFQLVPLLVGLLLFTRLGKQSVSWIANFPLAILIGVAAATTLTGVLLGTLLPQFKALLISINDVFIVQTGTLADLMALIGQIILLIGVIIVLLSFSFTRTRVDPATNMVQVSRVHLVGHWILIFSLGIVFAGALITYQTALIDRILFMTRQLGLG